MQDREREGWDDRTVPPRVVELQRERETPFPPQKLKSYSWNDRYNRTYTV